MSRPLLAPLSLAVSLLLGCGGGGGGGHHSTPAAPGIVRIGYAGETPATGTTVTFYDASGTALGTLTVDATGLIAGTVPAAAVRFGIDASTTTVGGPYYETYQYGDNTYSSSVSGCSAPLSKQGSATLKYDVILFPINSSNPPPPPPTGCGTGAS